MATSTKTSGGAKKASKAFYTLGLSVEKEASPFFLEYNMLLKTTDAVNNFNSLYRTGRTGVKGASTHAQQDLYRAMFVFACAGLDVFLKQLVRSKLPRLVEADKAAEIKFKEYVRSGLKKDDKVILNTIALALIDKTPREVFLNEYIDALTSDSLQSVQELRRVADASGLDGKALFSTDRMNALKDAFVVRNQIIHEMDISIASAAPKTTAYRTRRQRKAPDMERHTKTILNLTQDLFSAYKAKFEEYKIEVPKETK
jgi:hypothetical protein